MRSSGAICSSFQMPTSPWVMRPSAVTAAGLDHHEPGAALGELAEMHEVPVIGEAVGCRVLAHR
ncbi:hypothetical protein ACVWY2_005744 [Bradyrhizobium sp. JR6.1]